LVCDRLVVEFNINILKNIHKHVISMVDHVILHYNYTLFEIFKNFIQFMRYLLLLLELFLVDDLDQLHTLSLVHFENLPHVIVGNYHIQSY